MILEFSKFQEDKFFLLKETFTLKFHLLKVITQTQTQIREFDVKKIWKKELRMKKD
jgi:hypothetical protein